MLKKVSLVAFIFASLLISFQSNASFREALSALQHKNAEQMVLEVENAVSTEDVDSLTLFVSTLDEQYYAEEFLPDSVKKDRLKRSYRLPNNYEQLAIRWDGFLSEKQHLLLLNALRKVKVFDFAESSEVTKRLIINLQQIQYKSAFKISEDNSTPYYLIKEKITMESFYRRSIAARPIKMPVIELFQSSPSYALEIYDDGLVRYSSSNRSYREYVKNKLELNLRRAQVSGLYEWKISPKQVELLVNDLRALGIRKIPKNMSTTLLCDTGERAAHTFVNFNGTGLVKKIHLQGWVGHKNEIFPEQGAILETIEKHVPINQFICGENSLIVGYSSCISRNMRGSKLSQGFAKLPQVEK